MFMEQCLFGVKLKSRIKHLNPIWHLLQGIALWTIWVERNDLVFNQKQWSQHHVESFVWGHFLDYGGLAWKEVLLKFW
jgi:hypothetical protein